MSGNYENVGAIAVGLHVAPLPYQRRQPTLVSRMSARSLHLLLLGNGTPPPSRRRVLGHGGERFGREHHVDPGPPQRRPHRLGWETDRLGQGPRVRLLPSHAGGADQNLAARLLGAPMFFRPSVSASKSKCWAIKGCPLRRSVRSI